MNQVTMPKRIRDLEGNVKQENEIKSQQKRLEELMSISQQKKQNNLLNY